MRIIRGLENKSGFNAPVVATIGTYDSVHRGHQVVLNRTKTIAESENLPAAVVTFENHPFEVLRPDCLVPQLCTLEHKIRLLEQFGIDVLVLLKFTKEFSLLSAEDFLRKLYAALPFAHLVLGYDTAFGKDKKGDRLVVQKVAAELNSNIEYLEPFTLSDQIISSSAIRTLVQAAKFNQAAELLGRPYSIVSNAGIPPSQPNILLLNVERLCLPPAGNYDVTVIKDNTRYPAIARINSVGQFTLELKVSVASFVNQFIEIVF